MVSKIVVFEDRCECTGSTTKSKGVHSKHRSFRIGLVFVVASLFVFAVKGFTHEHPHCVGNRSVVTTSKHELICERVFRSTVVERHSTVFRSSEVRRNYVRCISRAAAEVTCLVIVAHQDKGHIGQEANVFQTLLVVVRNLNLFIG